jgi:uncharacterized protein YndB with AHSA1/START domain
MTDTVTAPVVRRVVVASPVETCFTTFVDGFGRWWPPEHHIGDRTIVEFHIEPRAGGRCYDVDTDGGECQWGTVLVYEPPARVVLAWHVQGDWTIDLDPARQSEVEVTFRTRGPERTEVRLEHRELDRHGGGAQGVRDGVDSPGGWGGILSRFLDLAEGRAPRPLPAATSS